jgi:hypothetical protein
MFLFTITAEHVAQQKAVYGDRATLIVRQAGQARSAMGPLQTIDIGKRVYRNSGIVQVENDQQRDTRLAKAR